MEPDKAYKLLDYLQTIGLMKNVGSMPRAAGVKGRGENIYEGDSAEIREHFAGLRLEG